MGWKMDNLYDKWNTNFQTKIFWTANVNRNNMVSLSFPSVLFSILTWDILLELA